MLRTAAPAAAALLALGGCGGGGDGAGDPGGELADRVIAALGDSDAVGGDVERAQVTCPHVDAPEAGDRATCALRFDDGRTADVDLEFDADGSFAVIAVVAP